MKSILVLIFSFLWCSLSMSFEARQTAEKLLLSLNAGDSASFFQFFTADAQLHHISDNGLETMPLLEFSEVLTKFKTGQYREVFEKIEIHDIQTGLIYADVSFKFYINEALSFSGVDHIIWVKNKEDYKITTLYSGALKPKFTNSSGLGTVRNELNAYMDQWHKDAANAEFEKFFDFMSTDFIYLGTDPEERWTKTEFGEFCKPYFDSKNTWDFKPNWRNWYMNDREDVAWFEESIDTWMEECRGSGVLLKSNGKWQLAHYNLTVLIENSKIQKFIKLRKK